LLKVGEIAGNSVKIYPNPTSGIVTLDWGSAVRTNITVSNIIGQVLLTETSNGRSSKDLNLSHLPAGNYIITLKDENGGVSTHKVLLEK
jgi:hypothetical protein